MALLDKILGKKDAGESDPNLANFVNGFSIEVMPRTAEKVEDFRAILPTGTRVYVAHIEGTPIEDMVNTAKRITDEGFDVMPHFPARIIKDEATLADWISRYSNEAGIKQALLLAGGVDNPHGDYHSSMQLFETGLFDKAGYTNIHFGAHPENNTDIDPDGSYKNAMAALRTKQGYVSQTDAQLAFATQFCFEAEPVIEWADMLKREGITIPVHIGIAGPAKLQTMIKFAIACGVGPSLRVLKKRAADAAKLLLPFEPDEILNDLAAHAAKTPDFNITQVHFFPLGGIKKNAEWANNALNGDAS